MSALVKFGVFYQRSGTGTQDVTGIGFRPTGLIIFGNFAGVSSANGGSNTWRTGLSDGTHNVSYTVNSGNFLNAVEVCESAFAQTKCFLGVSTAAGPFFTPALTTYGYIQSFNPDGFTANFEYNLGGLCTGTAWCYLALGGDIQTHVGTVSTHGTGTATVSGLPFTPTALVGWNTTDQVGPSNGSIGAPRFGFAVACDLQQCALSGAIGSSVSTSNDQSIQIATAWVAATDLSSSVVWTGMTSDGFSITFSGFGVTAQYYMAIGGCAANLGTFTQPTSTGSQAVPIDASVPRGMLVIGRNKPTSLVGGPDFLATIGGYDGTTQGSAWTGTLDGQTAPFKGSETIDVLHAIIAWTPTGDFAATVNTIASLTALNAGSFDVSWTQVDGVQREWYYLILADDVGTDACGTAVAAIHLTCPSITTGTIGLAYSSSFTVTGGTAPYTYSITAGALPPGLSLNTSTGAITGTPTTVGTYPYTGHVVDAGALTDSANCEIVIADTCPRPIIGTVGEGAVLTVAAETVATAAACLSGGFLLTEDGGHLLLETGGRIEIEGGTSTRPTIGGLT